MTDKKFAIQVEKSRFCKRITHGGQMDVTLIPDSHKQGVDLWIVKLLKGSVVHYTIEIYRSPVHESTTLWRAFIKEKETDKIIAIDDIWVETTNDAVKYIHDQVEDGFVQRTHVNSEFNTDKDFLCENYLCHFIYRAGTSVNVKIGHLIFKGILVKNTMHDCSVFEVNLFKTDGVSVLRSITVDKKNIIFIWP